MGWVQLGVSMLLWTSIPYALGEPKLTLGPASTLHSSASAGEEITGLATTSRDPDTLIVWQQGGHYIGRAGTTLHAALVTQSGTVSKLKLDQCKQGSPRSAAQVAHTEHGYLIVWQDFRNGRDWDIYASAVAEEGTIAEPCGVLVAGGPGNQAMPSITAVGNAYLVVWQQDNDDTVYRLAFAELDGTGTATAISEAILASPSDPTMVTYSPGWQGMPVPGPTDPSGAYYATGGTPQITSKRSGPVALTWINHLSWSTGRDGGIPRQFAHLTGPITEGAVVGQISRAPAPSLSERQGTFVTGQGGRALFANPGAVGKGDLPVISSTLLTADGDEFLVNPNEERPLKASGWDTSRMTPLFGPPFVPSGPVAAAEFQNGFIVIAAGTGQQGSGLYWTSLGDTGSRQFPSGSPALLMQSNSVIGAVSLTLIDRGFRLSWTEEDESSLLTTLRSAEIRTNQ